MELPSLRSLLALNSTRPPFDFRRRTGPEKPHWVNLSDPGMGRASCYSGTHLSRRLRFSRYQELKFISGPLLKLNAINSVPLGPIPFRPPKIMQCSETGNHTINMAQTREIYARLFRYVDAATSLLLKQDLVNAEFIRAENQRIFTKLVAVQDAATLRRHGIRTES